MESLIERVGSFGRFQKMILFVIGPVASLSGLVAFSSVFNNAAPKLLCKPRNSNHTLSSNTCEILLNLTRSENDLIEAAYECYYDTYYYGTTIVTEWNLICDKIHLASLTQTIYMLGAASSIIVGYFSDRYGRKKVIFFIRNSEMSSKGEDGYQKSFFFLQGKSTV